VTPFRWSTFLMALLSVTVCALLVVGLFFAFCGTVRPPRISQVSRNRAASNLEQIYLGVRMYRDRYGVVPQELDSLVSTGIVSDSALGGHYSAGDPQIVYWRGSEGRWWAQASFTTYGVMIAIDDTGEVAEWRSYEVVRGPDY